MKLSISKTNIILFFIFIWYFEPAYFSTISWLDSVFTLGKIASFTLIIFRVFKKRHIKFSGLAVTLLLYALYYIFNTFAHNGAVVTAITSGASLLGLYFSCQYFISRKSNLISVLLFIFELLIYCNLITVILFPHGIYNVQENANRYYWLLGHQNQVILYVLCAFVITGIYSYDIKKSNTLVIRSKVLAIASVLSIVLVWSATAIVGLVIVGFVVFLHRRGVKINTRSAVLVSILLFFGFVVYRIQDYFSVIIVKLLNRNLTFTGRTGIWDRALYYIKDSFLFGYGVEPRAVIEKRLGFGSCHNRYLNELYQGGIVAVILILSAINSVAKKIDRSLDNKCASVICACIWALLIQMQFETYANIIFFLPFICADLLDFPKTQNSQLK